MSFFIPGHTACAICGTAIQHRWQAAQLALVSPSRAPALAPLARRYVHRGCWEQWPERSTYIAAAGGLLLDAPGQSDAPQVVFEEQGTFVFEVPVLDGCRLHDVVTLVTFDISNDEICSQANWLEAAGSQTPKEAFRLGGEIWEARQRDTGLEITRLQADEPIERFILLPVRHDLWVTVLRRLCASIGKP